MNIHFQHVLDDGISKAPADAIFVAVHVCSSHMSVFYDHYATFEKLVSDKGFELIEPQCYSNIVVVWDLKENRLVFDRDCDHIGLGDASVRYYELHKDDPKPKPVEPEPIIPLTDDRLMVIAEKTSYRKDFV
jgi:hypothetical protein